MILYLQPVVTSVTLATTTAFCTPHLAPCLTIAPRCQISRGFGYQTPRAIKGTLAGWASSGLVMWIGLLIFGDEVARVGGDIVVVVVGAIVIVVCSMQFVGRRKETEGVAPALASDPSFKTLALPALLTPSPAASAPAGEGGQQPKQGGDYKVLRSLFITVFYAFLYSFVVVPLFMTLPDMHKLAFRLVVHPFVVLTGGLVLRETAAAQSSAGATSCGAEQGSTRS